MLEVLKILLNGGLVAGLCVLSSHILKFAIAYLVCRHPELSNDKVKSLTKMATKDTKIFQHQ